jgi:transposase
MMGRLGGGQGQFFYLFDLDTGRPSIVPLLMIRMLIVGYIFAIRSKLRLCAEVQVNLAYR